MIKKKCKKCEITKSSDCFYQQPKSKGGISSRCKECLSKQSLNGYYKDQDRRKTVAREYARKNVLTVRKRNRENAGKYRTKGTIKYQMANKCRKRIRSIMKLKFQDKYNKFIGCSPSYLKSHLGSLFRQGMSWSNYGEWTIDHIIPLCKFNLEDPHHMMAANHYSNLQPLWRKENDVKSMNYDSDHPLGCFLLDEKHRL